MHTIQLHVADCVHAFFVDVGTNLGAVFAWGDGRIGSYDRLMLANEVTVGLNLDRLYSNLAIIVSYRSLLIDIPGEDLVDHVEPQFRAV